MILIVCCRCCYGDCCRCSCLRLLKCCFTSTETVGLLGVGAQDVHLVFHTAPELSVSLAWSQKIVVVILGMKSKDCCCYSWHKAKNRFCWNAVVDTSLGSRFFSVGAVRLSFCSILVAFFCVPDFSWDVDFLISWHFSPSISAVSIVSNAPFVLFSYVV